MEFPALVEVEKEISAHQKALADIFNEAGPDLDMDKVKSLTGDSDAKVAHVAGLNLKLADLANKRQKLNTIKLGAENAIENEGHTEPGAGQGPRKAKTLGQQFAKSAARTQMNVKFEADFEVKTLMSRSAGWAPESFREPGYVPYASAPIMVADLYPVLPNSTGTVKYMEQTTRTNNAAERAEGAIYGEAAFVLTERTAPVETIGVWLPVTDEELEDETDAGAMIDMELPMMLRQRLDLQMLVGDGSTPNILGVNNKASIQTQAKGSDPVFDAIHKAMTKVRVVGRATPSAVVMHDNDWEGLALTRTADGIYILGNPESTTPKQVWGMQVVTSDNQTENTAVVGDFVNWSRFYLRRGVVMERTNSHDTYFVLGKQAIRASIRGCTVYKRAAAFCTVTGI